MIPVATGFGLSHEPTLCVRIEVYSEISRTGATLVLVGQAAA